jgi:putative DNA primase/helicase
MNYLEPWPEPVDGAEVLYSIEATLRRYVSMPDGSPELVALWVMFTWAIDASDIAPRLFLTSPMRRCGKTTVLDILTALVHRPEANVNVTAASLYTAIDQEHCTLILDEADQWVTKRGPVMGVLNSGHSRATAFVPRVIGGVRIKYSTYAAIAIAALGRPLPATLEDRCLTVRMRRKKRDEMLERFSLHHTDELTELARKCHRWSINNGAAVRAADPEIPKGLSDRAADNVRILLAIADVARGTWPERARRAVEICCSETDETEDETAIVRDSCQAFEQHKAGRMRSVDLARELTLLDRRRYPGLTANALARQLDLFEIRPQTLRMGTQTPRGYERTQFDDAMERYAISLDDGPTPPARPTATSATATHRHGVDEFMTALPVAEAVFQTTLRVIDAEARQQSEASSRPTDEEGRMPVPTSRTLH